MSGSLAAVCTHSWTTKTKCLHVEANTGPAAAGLSLESNIEVRCPLAVTSHELLGAVAYLTLVEAQQDVVPR